MGLPIRFAQPVGSDLLLTLRNYPQAGGTRPGTTLEGQMALPGKESCEVLGAERVIMLEAEVTQRLSTTPALGEQWSDLST
jgi:hypothetical protein